MIIFYADHPSVGKEMGSDFGPGGSIWEVQLLRQGARCGFTECDTSICRRYRYQAPGGRTHFHTYRVWAGGRKGERSIMANYRLKVRHFPRGVLLGRGGG